MDRLEFEADLQRDGFSAVYSSLTPNMKVSNHCHDFDARLFVLGGEITMDVDEARLYTRALSASERCR